MDLPDTDSVTIKTEPGADKGRMSPTEMDIDLPDVKKECLAYSQSVKQTAVLGKDFKESLNASHPTCRDEKNIERRFGWYNPQFIELCKPNIMDEIIKETPIIDEEVVVGSIEVEKSADIEDNKLSTQDETVSMKIMFKCDECESEFTRAWALNSHKRTHSGEKPYQCPECRFATRDSGALYQHKRIHLIQKPHPCNECDFACASSSNLKRHKLIHSGEKPYSCDVCGYSTTQSGSLKLHKRIHTGERPYKCDICGKKFMRPQHLNAHRRTHPGHNIAPSSVFSCLKCNFTTNSQWNLKSHDISHSDSKPFQCDQCSFKCKILSTLKRHERTHSGERPYTCEECGKKFTQAGALNKHMQAIHLKSKK